MSEQQKSPLTDTSKASRPKYRGITYRNPTVARWAVFFYMMSIKAEYKKHIGPLLDAWYLPDFWLPKLRRWVYIQDSTPTQEDLEAAKSFHDFNGYPVGVFYDAPGLHEGYIYYSDTSDSGGGDNSTIEPWSVCQECDTPDFIHNYGSHVIVNMEKGWKSVYNCKCDAELATRSPSDARLLVAYREAQAAQFESGSR